MKERKGETAWAGAPLTWLDMLDVHEGGADNEDTGQRHQPLDEEHHQQTDHEAQQTDPPVVVTEGRPPPWKGSTATGQHHHKAVERG